MANNPQKSKDATQDALAAIDEALNIREGDRIAPAETGRGRPAAPAGTDLFGEPVAGPRAEDALLRRPANDDRAAIGKILQSLQRRPSRLPWAVAILFTLAWVGGAVALGYLYRAELSVLFGHPDMRIPAMIALGAAAVVPVVFFFVVAQVIRRTQDLRLATQTIAEVAMRFAEPEIAARDSVVSVGQAIRREVAAMGDGVERALARAAELEALVHNEVSALERAYNDNEVRIRDLLTELSNQRDTLVDQAETVRNAIASVHLDLSHDITSVGDIVAERVNEVAQRITRTLTEKGEHITLALGHAGDSMIDALGERGSTLLQRLETTSDSATTAIASASERLSSSLSFKTENIHDEFSELSARLQQMMATRLDQVAQSFSQRSTGVIEQMESRSRQITEGMVETSSRLADTIGARAEEVSSTLRSTGDSLVLDLSLRGGDVVSKIEQTASRVTDSIVERGNKVAADFNQQSQSLVETIDERTRSVSDALTVRTKAFDELFAHHGTALTEKISRDSSALGDLIIRHIGEFDRTVKTYGGELVEKLGERTEGVSTAMRNYIDSFDSRVTTRTEEVSGKLAGHLDGFETSLDGRVNKLAATLAEGGKEVIVAIDQRVGDVGNIITNRGDEVARQIETKIQTIDKTLGARATEVADTLDNRVGRFEELLVGRAETVTNQIESRTKAAADALNSRMEQLSQSIKSNAGEAEKALSQLAMSASEQIRNSATEAQASLTGASNEIARSFTGKAEEITAAVTKQTGDLTTTLSDQTSGVLAALEQKGQQFTAEITRATGDAVKSIETTGLNFARAMSENSADIARQINTAGENATGTLNKTLADLQDKGVGAIEQSRDTAHKTVTDLLETHNMLRSDSVTMFERLREANLMLQEVLSGAHENMGALENTMMLRVSEFVSAMNRVNETTGAAGERVEQNIGAFRDATGQVLADLGQLAEQFDVRGRDLARAAQMIEASNQRTDESVNQRRLELESLINTLDIRTEDLGSRLTRFSSLLDEALETAANRAREVARVAADSSSVASSAISDQLENLRAAAEEERDRTAGSMRVLYEQSIADSQSMFNDAAERFADVVHGMKQMSSEIQRELEQTREQLRRGILEMPQEASESAAQMRRVLVDQIEALAELNRIVAKHGRAADAVEPTRRAQDRVSEPALAVVGGREPARETMREPAREVPPPPRPPRNETPSRFDFGGSQQQPRRGEPAPSAVNNQTRGWLTELLNRASREEQETPTLRDTARDADNGRDERTQRHAIESLDSLSVDIARMIDHDAASDLWDRYKRGERNVFTRRLYTLQGQKAFDEIQRKYRGDREFRQTVDRYVAEFERLLEEVSRDDRGQMVTRTYLTSETGKVYTMLAHAAGRFG